MNGLRSKKQKKRSIPAKEIDPFLYFESDA